MRAIKLNNNALAIGFKRLLAGCLLLIATGAAKAQNTVNLTDIVYSKLSGDNIQINLLTDGTVGVPGSFSTDRPARIALDFFGMKKQLGSKPIKIAAGQVDSVVAVETPDRTRVIINLFDTARYEVSEVANGYAITVFNANVDDSRVRAPKPFAERPDIVPDTSVSNIDFRRSEAGGGSLIIDLSDENVTIDTRESDGEIIVDLLDVSVPPELERRLDVVDFATPVQTVDAFQNAGNARLVVVPRGKYQHFSFQAGNRYTLTVDPIIETVDDQRNEDDLALGYQGERLSINFQKIDVRSALTVIADFTGINFVTSDSVTGEITINLKDVPWDQALDVIMRTKGLAKRQTGNVIWIAPANEIQRIEEAELKANALQAEFAPLVTELIQINYAKASDIANVIKTASFVRLEDDRRVSSNPRQTLTDSDSVSSSSSFDDARTDSRNGDGTGQPSGNSLLTERGSVTVDQRTNSLLIQDVAGKAAELRTLIKQLDKPVRQVLIETRIVEASDTFSRELGAKLGFQRITENARFPGVNDSNIGTVIGSGSIAGTDVIGNSFINNGATLDSDNPLTFDSGPSGLAVDLGANGIEGNSPGAYAFDIFRAGTGFAHLITLELSALEADGRGKVVASPRLVTSNQKEAAIRQGEERVFTVPGSGLTSGNVQTKKAELELIVTPQITPDDRVILDVQIIQDTFIPNADLQVASAIRTKEILTQVLADNGETIVIGGIYQEDNSEGTTKVPILGDIPILGNLFKKRSRRDNRVELLIFLTPKIISPKLNLG